MSTFYIKRNDNDLIHYGVLGMKWGIRRYQNPDGSLTKEGRKKYLKGTTASRVAGSIIGTLIGGGLGSIILSNRAYKHQVQRNIEKDERQYEREQVSKMSDKELNEFNYRKNLERQLSDILTKENELMGEDYVSETLNVLKSGANLLKSASDVSLSISLPNEKQKKENKDKENKALDLRIQKINERREAIKKEAIADSKKTGNTDKLNDRIKEINNRFDTEIKKEREASKERIKIYNKAVMAARTNRLIDADRNRINTAAASIQDIARLYKQGVNVDTSDMSTKDLQKLVDRTRAEQQYLNIVSPVNTSSGMQYVANVANTYATIAGVASREARAVRGV